MMNNLIAELEAAPKGSRKLDVKIHCVLHDRIGHPKLPKGYTMKDLGNKDRNRGLAESQFIHSDRGPSPFYTTSLDAKLTWENISETALYYVDLPSKTMWRAWDEVGDTVMRVMGQGHTEPLARRAAALRAYQAMKEVASAK